jgi:hypothetical protein
MIQRNEGINGKKKERETNNEKERQRNRMKREKRQLRTEVLPLKAVAC